MSTKKILIYATESDITLDYACQARETKAFGASQINFCSWRPSNPRTIYLSVTGVWLAMLTATGGTLVIFGLATDHCCDYHKLFVSIGIILLMCAMLLASFFFFDTRSFQKYTMHILVPWFLCSIIIFFGIVIAFSFDLISVKLFLITSLPIFSLAAFVFSEIFHYLGRIRVRPLHLQLKEITKGDNYQKPLLSSASQTSWTSRVITLTSNGIKENGSQKSDSLSDNQSINKQDSTTMGFNNGGVSSDRSSTLSYGRVQQSGVGGRQQTVFAEETETQQVNQRNLLNTTTTTTTTTSPSPQQTRFKSAAQQQQTIAPTATSNGESSDHRPRIEHTSLSELYKKKVIRNSLSPGYKSKPANNKRQQTQRLPKKSKNGTMPYLTNLKIGEVKWFPSDVLKKK